MGKIGQGLRNLSLQIKILIPGVLIIVIFLTLTFLYIIPRMKDQMIEQKKMKLTELTESVTSLCAALEGEYRAGSITREEAQRRAIGLIKKIRFGAEGKDYFWINDFLPRMIMHPYRSDLDGNDISDFTDRRGKRLFVEMAEVCKRSGKGFVTYMWQWKDQAALIVPKISFVQTFEPWGWIIGTGVYIQDVEDEIWAVQKILMAVISAISLFLVLFLLVITRMITRPMKEVIAFAGRISQGKLDMRLDYDGSDEIGALFKALNESAEQLEGMVRDIRQGAESLNLAVSEIARGNQELSQRTTGQASSLEEIAATIEETSATTKQNADNARRLDEVARSTLNMGNRGGEVLGSALSSINEINDSSRKIVDIVSLINEIAFQTNLLSLNAAVEAARAGEQGRSFAVVAGEVRSLATRSATAVKDIEKLIGDSLDKIKTGTGLANQSGEALQEIISSINKVSAMVSEIAAASQEQTQGMEQISTAVMELDHMTQQNAAMVEQYSSASEEMMGRSADLLALTEKFVLREQ